MGSLAGPIIVTGGCGFFGSALVRALLKEPNCGPVTCVSRNPESNREDGVDYRAGSITDSKFIHSLFSEIKPQVIFHTASPRPLDTSISASGFKDTNVEGTKVLINASRETPSVKAFIYTSSVNVSAGSPHVQITEDMPMWQPDSKAIPYWRSKAEAERAVIAANCPELKTVSLRLPLIIGVGDHALIPAQIDAYEQKRTGVQLGDGKNLVDAVSTENGSIAHILAAKALLDSSYASGKVEGEAFHITDGNPRSFWDMSRIIWAAAGDTTKPSEVKVIPAWAAMAMASVAEATYAVFTLGTKTPELNRHVVDFCITEYTYNIDKAKQRLHYNPQAKTEEILRDAVEWELQKRGKKSVE